MEHPAEETVVTDLVVGLFSSIFERVFATPFRRAISNTLKRLEEWPRLDRMPLAEWVFALHMFGEDEALLWMTEHEDLYFAPGPHYEHPVPLKYRCQGEIALLGLSNPRQRPFDPNLALKILLPIFRAITELPVHTDVRHHTAANTFGSEAAA